MLAKHLAVFNAFESLAIPTLCAVQGLCLGGGLELALRADFVVAGETARFGHPEQSIGVATLLGGIYRVAAKAGRAKAMEWALTSEKVPAPEMERHGVINKVVPDAQLLEEALAFAHRIAAGPTRAHAAHKALLNAWSAGGCLPQTMSCSICACRFLTPTTRKPLFPRRWRRCCPENQGRLLRSKAGR